MYSRLATRLRFDLFALICSFCTLALSQSPVYVVTGGGQLASIDSSGNVTNIPIFLGSGSGPRCSATMVFRRTR
jgi:hypothetical protein